MVRGSSSTTPSGEILLIQGRSELPDSLILPVPCWSSSPLQGRDAHKLSGVIRAPRRAVRGGRLAPPGGNWGDSGVHGWVNSGKDTSLESKRTPKRPPRHGIVDSTATSRYGCGNRDGWRLPLCRRPGRQIGFPYMQPRWPRLSCGSRTGRARCARLGDLTCGVRSGVALCHLSNTATRSVGRTRRYTKPLDNTLEKRCSLEEPPNEPQATALQKSCRAANSRSSG